MFSVLRRRLSYTNVVVTLAFVFAMSGGAYAAGKFVITSTKQIKPSVLKQLQGKPGTPGPAGAAGAGGAQGPAGPGGAQGPAGPQGAKGDSGTAGTNGTNGTNGKEGSPWSAGGTLPQGAQETGAWLSTPTSAEGQYSSVSFPIALAAGLDTSHTLYVKVSEWKAGGTMPAGCKGNAEEPEAEAGFLCVFEGPNSSDAGAAASEELLEGVGFDRPGNNSLSEGFGAGPTGAIVLLVKNTAAETFFEGSWAVRAP
jgi:hypothetical protein